MGERQEIVSDVFFGIHPRGVLFSFELVEGTIVVKKIDNPTVVSMPHRVGETDPVVLQALEQFRIDCDLNEDQLESLQEIVASVPLENRVIFLREIDKQYSGGWMQDMLDAFLRAKDEGRITGQFMEKLTLALQNPDPRVYLEEMKEVERTLRLRFDY